MQVLCICCASCCKKQYVENREILDLKAELLCLRLHSGQTELGVELRALVFQGSPLPTVLPRHPLASWCQLFTKSSASR